MGIAFTVKLHFSAPALLLQGDVPATSFALESIITSFVLRKTFTTLGDFFT